MYDNVNNKILTISNTFDQNIGLPKGECNKQENINDAAFRELHEETGLLFTIQPEIQYTFTIKNKLTIIVVYLPNGSELQLSPNKDMAIKENISNVTWRTYENLISNLEHVNYTLKKNKKSDTKDILAKIKNIFQLNYI